MTTFEQAWRDAYGTPEAWERERHGTAQEAQREVYGTPLHWRHRRESAEVERLRQERRQPANIFEQELADTLESARLTRERRAGA